MPPKQDNPSKEKEHDPAFFDQFATKVPASAWASEADKEPYMPPRLLPLALDSLGLTATPAQTSQFLADTKKFHKDRINRGRFLTFVTMLRAEGGNVDRAALVAAFKALDTDGSGYLESEEFVVAMCTGEGGMTRTEALAVMAEFDKDGNGKIDVDEFISVVWDRRAKDKHTQYKTAGEKATSMVTGSVVRKTKAERRRAMVSDASVMQMLRKTERGKLSYAFGKWLQFPERKRLAAQRCADGVLTVTFGKLQAVDAAQKKAHAAANPEEGHGDAMDEKYKSFSPEAICAVAAMSRLCEIVRHSVKPETLEKSVSVETLQVEIRKRVLADAMLALATSRGRQHPDEKEKKPVLDLDDAIDALDDAERASDVAAVVASSQAEVAEANRIVEEFVASYHARKRKALHRAGLCDADGNEIVPKYVPPTPKDDEGVDGAAAAAGGGDEPPGDGDPQKTGSEGGAGGEEEDEEEEEKVGIFESVKKNASIGDFLDFEFPLFPETTVEDRRKLQFLADTRPAVTREDVCVALNVEPDSQLIDFLYGQTSAKTLSKQVFNEVISSLKVEPVAIVYAPEYMTKQAASDRKMATFVPNIVILVLICVVVPLVASGSLTGLFAALAAAVDDEFESGCPDGPTSSLGCNFLGKSLASIKYPTMDVYTFAREQFIKNLWPNEGGTAIDEPYASAWLLGSLVVRFGPEKRGPGRGTNGRPCVSNITTEATNLNVGRTYGCGEFWKIDIPFSYTQEEALAAAQAINITSNGASQQNTVLTFDFFAFQRANGYLSHVRANIGLSANGGVWPSYTITPINPDAHKFVLPVMIFQLISFSIAVGMTAFYAFKGVDWFSLDLVRGLFATCLIVSSYACLRYSANAFEGKETAKMFNRVGGSFWRADDEIMMIDTLAQKFNLGMSLFGFYVLLFMITLCRYLSDVPGLELITEVLSRAAIEIASLIIVFFVWTLGFIFASMVLFGPVHAEFANAATTSVTLLMYFLGEDNYDSLYQASPVVGSIFYVIFQLYVLFFALNLLIAVLTAPLEGIKELSNVDMALMQEIGEEVVAKKVNSTPLDLLKWNLYAKVGLPLTKICADGRPFGTGHWLQQMIYARALYPTGGRMTPVLARLKACQALMNDSEGLDDRVEAWHNKSALLQFALRQELIKGPVSLALLLNAITMESGFQIVRDARLLNACFGYARWKHGLEEILDIQDSIQHRVEKRTTAFSEKLNAAMECAEDAFAELTNTEKEAIALGKVTVAFSGVPKTEAELACEAKEKAEAEAAAAEGKVPKHHSPFHFEEEMVAKLARSRLLVLYSLAIVGFFLWITVIFFTRESSTSNLVAAASDGLMNMNFVTNCADDACAEALSFEKTFNDVGNLGDLQDWVSLVLGPQLFYRQEFAELQEGNDVHSLFGTWWDPRIERVGGVKIRQLRARQKTCHMLPISPSDSVDTFIASRISAIQDATPCFEHGEGHHGWSKVPPEMPDNLADAQPASAYIPLDTTTADRCTAYSRMDSTYIGILGSYPCYGGFFTEVNSTSELANVMDNWIDNVTRFVTFTVRLRVVPGPEPLTSIIQGPNVRPYEPAMIDYTMFVELGDQGGSAKVHTRGFVVTEPVLHRSIKAMLIVFQVVIALNLGIYILMYVLRFIKILLGEDPETLGHLAPEVPLTLICVNFCVWVVAYPAWEGLDRRIALAVLMICYVEYLITTYVVAPAASFLSRPVMVLINTLTIAIANCLYVVPFLVIFYFSFAFSGTILFGRAADSFATVNRGVLSCLLGTFGVWDHEAITVARPVEAQLFTLFFYCAVLIVVANLFLAMITGASGEANERIPSVQIAEEVLPFYGRWPLFGDFTASVLAVETWYRERVRRLAAELKLLQQKLPDYEAPKYEIVPRPEPMPAVLTPTGRVWFPSECLHARIRPIEIQSLLARMSYTEMSFVSQSSLVPFLISHIVAYEQSNPVEYEEDERMNMRLATTFAANVAVDSLRRRCEEETKQGTSVLGSTRRRSVA